MELVLSEQRQKVFEDRYALRDEDGVLLETSVEQMWTRVAGTVATNYAEYEDFLRVLSGFDFVPGGRILAGAGSSQAVTYYNCFVLPIESQNGHGCDSRHAIMETMVQAVEIVARGGGIGINWSVLRPSRAYIRGVAGRSTGPIAWATGMNAMIEQISQGGSRTGAQMYMLNDWHPDVLDFVRAKEDLSRLQRANMSVGVSDAFMQAVKDDAMWELRFPDTTCVEYNRLWDGDIDRWASLGLPVVVYGSVSAREMWHLICEKAWQNGEPGVVFLDRYNKQANTWYMDRVLCTNPCGEQGLPGWGVCNLGSINLGNFWDMRTRDVDWARLSRTVRTAVSFLDNVIDISAPVNDQTDAKQRKARRIGIGTMGLADLLLAARRRYGTQDALMLIEQLYEFIRDEAYAASVGLAKERGAAPGFDAEQFLKGEFIQRLPEDVRAEIGTYGIRNLTLLTQAPTGTTGILAGASSGIEPVFAWVTGRKDATGDHETEHPAYAAFKRAIPAEVAITYQPGNDLSALMPMHMVTAHQLTPLEHVRTQAVIQQYVDSSISKTVNAPANHTVADVEWLYMYAYDSGCKGVTYYRSGSRKNVLTDLSQTSKVCIKDPETGACSICD